MWNKILSKLEALSFTGGLFVIFALLLLFAHLEIKGLDIWLHLATGRYILEHHSVPSTDIFSFTAPTAIWFNHEWLFQVIMAAIEGRWGYDGLHMFQALLVGGTCAGLYLVFPHQARQRVFILPLLFCVVCIYQTRMTMRPDLVSVFFMLILLHLVMFRRQKASSLVWLFLLQVLWVNVHHFFVFSPMIIFIAWFCVQLEKLGLVRAQKGSLEPEQYRQDSWMLGSMFLISIVGSLVSPYGLNGLIFLFKSIFHFSGEMSLFRMHIGELLPPWDSNIDRLSGISFAILTGVSLLTVVLNIRRLNIFWLLIWGITMICALRMSRVMIFFAVIAYGVTLLNMRQLSDEGGPLLKFFGQSVRKRLVMIGVYTMMIVFAVQIIAKTSLNGYFDYDQMKRKSEFSGVSLKNFPAKAVDFLKEQEISGRFLNNFNSGSYLIGHVWPKIEVYIDGRTDIYGQDFFADYRKIMAGDMDRLNEQVQKYNIRGAFLSYGLQFSQGDLIKKLYDSPEWELVYFDDDAVIFLRNISENDPWIRKLRINLANYHPPELDFRKIGLMPISPAPQNARAKVLYITGHLEQAEEELSDAMKINTASPGAWKLKGRIALDRKQYFDAYISLRQSKLRNSSDMETRYYLSQAFFGLGWIKESWDQVMLIHHDNPQNPFALLQMVKIFMHQKDFKRANQYFVKGVKNSSSWKVEMDECIDMARQMGREEMAVQWDLLRKQ